MSAIVEWVKAHADEAVVYMVVTTVASMAEPLVREMKGPLAPFVAKVLRAMAAAGPDPMGFWRRVVRLFVAEDDKPAG